jgi:hypothetical protein
VTTARSRTGQAPASSSRTDSRPGASPSSSTAHPGPLDISHASGRADGVFWEPWTPATVAICPKPRGGIHSESRIDAGTDGDLTCAGTGKIHRPGGGGLQDDGPGWLRKILPSPDLRSVQVGLTAPLTSNDMVVHSTCAN